MAPEETVTTSWRPSALGGAERVVVLYGPQSKDVGRAAMLSDRPLHIGRAEAEAPCLVLEDGKASRLHAVIERDEPEENYRIRDLSSRNGTYVNGVRVDVAPLTDGTVLRIGAHVLLYQVLDHEACLRLFDRPPPQSALVGGSPRMQQVHTAIRAAAAESFPVLVLGESGVGKELVARALHEQSGRDGALVSVNCAALPENLVESELFGHARGAFTGAVARRGLFKQAEGGTLFLDEIGDMRLDLQAKLLRVLVTGEVRPVGQDRAQAVDVRIVAATNSDLEAAVVAGTFRGDLYARLMGYVIRIAPLRERREDILELARHFLSGAGHHGNLGPDAAEALLVHDWPYNVRELEQVLRVVGSMSARMPEVGLECLPERLQQPFESRRGAARMAPPASSPLLTIRRDAPPNAAELREVLASCEGNISRVAAFFRKDRRQVYRWAERLGVDVAAYRDPGGADDDG